MSCYQELYVNIVQRHVQADPMHTIFLLYKRNALRRTNATVSIQRDTNTAETFF